MWIVMWYNRLRGPFSEFLFGICGRDSIRADVVCIGLTVFESYHYRSMF